jgi:uracil-DNA glycosylase
MNASVREVDSLLRAIRACRHCAETPKAAKLPHEPRPVLLASGTARLAVCSQAPGTRVYRSGIPFTDASGDRLRDWMGVSPQDFYDERLVAIVPMGFCFPGQDAKGADLPPRCECATLWHQRLFAALPQLDLILAVGSYAQNWHLGDVAGASLQETMPIGAGI